MTLVVLALDAVFGLTPAETSAALPGIAGLGHMLVTAGLALLFVALWSTGFIGAKLGNLLLAGGFRDVQTQTRTLHLDNREPARRKVMFALWEELLLSAADQLLAAEKVDQATVDGMRREFSQVQNDPDAVFFYSFVQARATVY